LLAVAATPAPTAVSAVGLHPPHVSAVGLRPPHVRNLVAALS
jgi:hypothetical protein